MPLIIKKIKNSISNAVKEMLEELGYVPEKKKIFIKPNIAVPTWPSSPYITNPQVVAGVIDYLKERGIKDIKVGDGPVPINFGAEETFKVCGYDSMCRDKGAELVNIDLLKRIKISERKDFAINIPELLTDHEYINIAKFKTHYQTTVSLSMKNQKGLLMPEDKNLFHRDLHRSIAILAKLVKPDLCIIDGSNGLEGNGPVDMGKEIENLNLLIAGNNMLATDELACHLMGIKPEEVKHLIIAREMGLTGIENEKILGENPESVKRNFERPTDYWNRGNLYYWWSDYTCSRCSLIEGEIIEKLEEIPLGSLKNITPAAFITGPPKTFIPENFQIYGLGKCAGFFCKKSGFKYIEGCPPEIDKVLKWIYSSVNIL